jgi:selenocysteine lyase/cysteine desulfurase
VGGSAQDLAFVQNATTGVNLAARALALAPGEEVLATDLDIDRLLPALVRELDAEHRQQHE